MILIQLQSRRDFSSDCHVFDDERDAGEFAVAPSSSLWRA
jgi:hypothetical protein